jgi:hypothetical protein
MTFKHLIKLSLICALIVPVVTHATHHPFQEFDPLNMPTKSVTLTYAKLMTIEQSKVSKLSPKDLSENPMFFAALLQNISIIEQETQEIELSFQAGTTTPCVTIPAGFPLNAHHLYMKYVCGQLIPEDLKIKQFGVLTGLVHTGPQNKYDIGHWTSEMAETPGSFLKKLHEGKRDFHTHLVNTLCARNQPLMDVIYDGLTRSNKELKGTDFIYPNLMEIYNFMHYLFGVKVTENPSARVRLSVALTKDTIDLPTKRAAAYEKGPLKRHLHGVLQALSHWGWTFDQATRSFVFNQS